MQPYQIMAAITAALALSFAAGTVYPTTAAAERTSAEALVADLINTPPVQYFPSQYQNQATEIEPLPPQF